MKKSIKSSDLQENEITPNSEEKVNKRLLISCSSGLSKDEENLIEEIKRELPSDVELTFHDNNNLADYILKAISDGIETIFIITSGSMIMQLEQIIQANQIISSIFVFKYEQEKHQEFTIKFPKIKCLTNNFLELKEKLMNEVSYYHRINIHWNSDMLSDLEFKSGHYFNSKQSCITFIYVDYVYSLFNEKKFSNEQSKQDFIQFCKDNYINFGGNDFELEQMINDCMSNDLEDKIIEWYTYETFFYQMLNKILKTDDFYSLFKLRHPIHLLNKQLIMIKESKEDLPSTLYRGGRIDKNEFKVFRNNIGQSILLRGFISTSNDLKVAERFADYNPDKTKFYSVVFLISVDKDKDVDNIHPIEAYSAVKSEKEYLFSNNTFLKINDINETLSYFSIISSLSNFDDVYDKYNSITLEYKKTLDKMRTEAEETNDNFYLFKIIRIMRKDELSLIILRDIKKESELTDNDEYLYSCYGDVYLSIGNYEEAVLFYQKSYNIRKAKFGESVPVPDTFLSIDIKNIPDVCESIKKYEKPNEYLPKFLNIKIAFKRGDHFSFDNNFSIFGLIYSEKAEYDMAINYFQKSINIIISTLGESHPDLISIYNNLAIAFTNNGDYEIANYHYKKSLDILISKYGEYHIDLVSIYNNYANVFSNKGEYDEAFKYYQKSLEIILSTLGESHADTASVYNNLAIINTFKKDYKIAKEYYQKSLTIKEKTLEKYHEDIASIFNNFGFFFYCKNEYDKAVEYSQKALNLRKMKLGDNHPDTIDSVKNVEVVNSKILK